MILSGTSDVVSIITGSALSTQVLASWSDITTTTFTPGRTTTIISGATTTTIVPSPAASTQRQVKTIVIRNNDASLSNLITVQFFDGTNTPIVFQRTLLAGESLEYNGSQWQAYDSSGRAIITNGNVASGSNTQIQFNDNGVIAGNSGLTFNKSTNKVALNGAGTGVQLLEVASDPSAPSSGLLEVYGRKISGYPQVMMAGDIDALTPLQNAQYQKFIVKFTPGIAAAGLWDNTAGTNLGTVARVAGAAGTTILGMMSRTTFASVVTTANQQVGTRSESLFFRGNTAGIGGFFFTCRFAFTQWTTGNRLFIGLSAATGALVTVDPSTVANGLGFGVDAADTAISFYSAGAATPATKVAIPGQPALATGNVYQAYIYCKPDDNTIYYRLDNLLTGAILVDTSTSSALPVNTTGLNAQAVMGNAANVVVGNATLAVNKIYIETNY
jgi:hypothetical protein